MPWCISGAADGGTGVDKSNARVTKKIIFFFTQVLRKSGGHQSGKAHPARHCLVSISGGKTVTVVPAPLRKRLFVGIRIALRACCCGFFARKEWTHGEGGSNRERRWSHGDGSPRC